MQPRSQLGGMAATSHPCPLEPSRKASVCLYVSFSYPPWRSIRGMQLLREHSRGHGPLPVIREYLIVGLTPNRTRIQTDYLRFEGPISSQGVILGHWGQDRPFRDTTRTDISANQNTDIVGAYPISYTAERFPIDDRKAKGYCVCIPISEQTDTINGFFTRYDIPYSFG